ncbi:class A sortase [Leuconostoc lactis]|uniref:sortase family protein n=1 Tax=Leuconostoc lactis TaxID=1246 RepID=UPI00102286EF|nr:class A sortase [Leuconostoc lactis]MSB65631.1 sortase [Leuconostoc lactis]RYS84993.1 class A sortase [Leuconostoc lactis]
MAINLNQFEHRQGSDQHLKRHKKHPMLKTLAVSIVGILVVTGVVVFGNHPQWQTAQQVKKINAKIGQPATKNKVQAARQQVVHASEVYLKSKEDHITPDYTGTGGLVNKTRLLKLANSQQPEILRGYIAMPSFKIHEAIYEGTSDHVLAIGAGLNTANLNFGKGLVPIFAHNMGDYNSPYGTTKFSALQNMTEKSALGKYIYLSDGQTLYKYRATHLDYGIPVSDLNQSLTMVRTGKPEVKLITCLEDQDFWAQVKKSNYTNFQANKRIVLTGELVSKQSLNTVDAKLKSQLK